MAGKKVLRAAADIPGRYMFESQPAVHPQHQAVALRPDELGDIKCKGQVPALVQGKRLPVQPGFRQVVNRIEAQLQTLSCKTPRQVEIGPVPGRAEEIAPVFELVIPAGRYGCRASPGKDALPAVLQSEIVLVKTEIPKTGQVAGLPLAPTATGR